MHMTSHKHDGLAKKYASAFLNLYHDELSDWYFENLDSLRFFLNENPWLYVYLAIPSVHFDVKKKVIHRISEIIQFCIHTEILILTLLKHNRIELLGRVIQQIQLCHKKRRGLSVFSVYSSHQLNENQKSSILDFIKKMTQSQVSIQFYQDPSLIVGLRIQNGDLRWERSMVRELRDIELDVLRQVSL